MKYSPAVECPAHPLAKSYLCFCFICLYNLWVETLGDGAVNISVLSALELKILEGFYILGHTPLLSPAPKLKKILGQVEDLQIY